jgi:transglutaminase superfamily protein
LEIEFIMPFLIAKAYLYLLRFELPISRGDFARLHELVRKYTVRTRRASPEAVENVCGAIDLACVFYWKQLLCLQRSAATVCLLRNYGVAAELVIGAQHLPFKAHAWVEVQGRVVNDKPYMREIYAVLDQR